jgi:hypothetical protein
MEENTIPESALNMNFGTTRKEVDQEINRKMK